MVLAILATSVIRACFNSLDGGEDAQSLQKFSRLMVFFSSWVTTKDWILAGFQPDFPYPRRRMVSTPMRSSFFMARHSFCALSTGGLRNWRIFFIIFFHPTPV